MDKRWFWLGGFIIVGVLLGSGLIFLVTRPPRGSAIVLLPAPTPAPITVYVTGEVNHAGLFSLPPGSRVNDAILAAGGFAADANTSGVNLAAILTDGQKLAIPGTADDGAAVGGITTAPGSVSMVDINLATLEQLDTLPGIGPKYAQDIIDYRAANGSFVKIEDIMNVPGIGQAKFDAIRDLISVGTSP